mmetsp:Transcript_6007/g.10798  ORF Transcript_6007/g.10798 Transcript_6007/m.10798 type:complete len:97 (+) Transcript_6007:3570-3860(+)
MESWSSSESKLTGPGAASGAELELEGAALEELEAWPAKSTCTAPSVSQPAWINAFLATAISTSSIDASSATLRLFCEAMTHKLLAYISQLALDQRT